MHNKSILDRTYSLEVHNYTGKIDLDCQYSGHIFLTWTQDHHHMEAILSGEKTGRVYRKFNPLVFIKHQKRAIGFTIPVTEPSASIR